MPQKAFEIDESVALPSLFTHHYVKGMHLLIVGSRPTWIVLNDKEYNAFKTLCSGVSIRKLLKTHDKAVVSCLLAKVEQARFYADDSSSRRTYEPKLTLYITNLCNLRCVHCYANAGEKLPDELRTEEWIEVIRQYSSLTEAGEVTISGGEPTLHLGLNVILKEISGFGHRIVLFTNGTTKGGKLGWSEIARQIDVVQLSIDGFDETTNNAIRGEGTYHKILEAYRAFYHTDVQIRLSVCAMPQNVDSLANGLLGFLKKYDPEKKIGLILSPTVIAGRNDEGKYAFDYPELQDGIGDTLDQIWRSGWRFPNTFQRNDHQPRCGIGSSILISPNGGYRACTFAPISG